MTDNDQVDDPAVAASPTTTTTTSTTTSTTTTTTAVAIHEEPKGEEHTTPASPEEDPSSSATAAAVVAAAAAVHTSNHVYIRHDEHGWIPGRLLETSNLTAVVSVLPYTNQQDIGSLKLVKKPAQKVTVNLQEYPNQALLLQNVNEDGKLQQVDDMVDLPFLHEAAILYNLKARHIQGKPYTRTGDIIVACNPYQWFFDLYSERKRAHYANRLVWQRESAGETGKDATKGHTDPRSTLEPHVYETSSLAYRGLAVEGDDQSILVSGESGAGKTETVKILLSDLASIQRGYHTVAGDDSDAKANNTNSTTDGEYGTSPIVQRVLDSNPLLEAFGNAKTVRNDNSSRFGKYIQLQFDAEDPIDAAYAGKQIPSCILAGSKCEVYLLEKSRVVSHEENERTYHIFYQLLAADEETKASYWEGLRDTDNESFTYVGFTETEVIEGKSDAERFQETVDSLAMVGIADDKLVTLMRAICIVLQLGNLVFDQDGDDVDRSTIREDALQDFEAVCELMGVESKDVLAALTIRTMTARNETFKVPLNAVQAKDSCDAFAKEIYAKTFLWLVRTINDATCAEKNYEDIKPKHRRTGFGLIGMLDIFGFESFETNRFEQLCINYANEKLQQKFTQDVFRSVQAEYEEEGIELEEIRYDDNTDVLDLVEGRMGLLAFLNEECVRPGGSDKGFVAKARAMNKDCACFLYDPSFGVMEFGVHHYAGKVMYDATNFVTKNMDTLPMDLQDCATKSSNAILANELSNESMMNPLVDSSIKKRRSPPSAKGNPKNPVEKKGSFLIGGTVWTKFKGQLTNLMTNLGKTRTRYIRCIKPNTVKEPYLMQHKSTLEQLRCAGVVAAVTISRSAFPNRLEHNVVLDRFKSLWPKGEHQHAEELVESEGDADSKAGKMVGALLTAALEELQVEQADGSIVKAFVIGRTRAYFRAGALEHLEAERIKGLSVWAVEIQKTYRRHSAVDRYAKVRKGMIQLQARNRERVARKKYTELRASAIMVECWYRCLSARQLRQMLHRNRKATLIQTLWRMSVAISAFKTKRRAAVAVQTMVRGALQRPKFRVALHEKREEAKLENQVLALQRKLEEAEARRIEAEKKAEEKARRAVEEFREEKKDSRASSPTPVTPMDGPSSPLTSKSPGSAVSPQSPTRGQLSAQQQTLMDESGKMLEYLRKEVFKLRQQNAQYKTDMELLKGNNQRLMDANGSAGASFAALNQHTKQLAKTNERLKAEVDSYKKQVQKINVTQVELKEELKMKQATYVAEVHSRLQYQKALSAIVDVVQEGCNDSRLVEKVLVIADACEQEYMSGPTGISRGRTSLFSSPSPTRKNKESGDDSQSGLMSSIRSLWS